MIENINKLYLLSFLIKAYEVKSEIEGKTGSIYLLILPEEMEKKTNIHKNHTRKNFIPVSFLNFAYAIKIPAGKNRLHGKKSRGRVVR
ncbi:MAG: hypothetical protein NT178_00645 [Proteobacteria bacterium]|nr:hypothetical protein [Pseudomonadota bacterium]